MSSQPRYALLYSEFENSSFLRCQFEKFTTLTVALPLFAFLFCIGYSVLFHFESATYTHCHVPNLLPSISAAIGNFSPQREVWQSAILLHACPRFVIAYMYLQHHQSILFPQDFWMAILACIMNVIENIALLILSFFTSSAHYPIHEKAFVTFILMSEFYMILTIIILQFRSNKQHRRSLRYKKILLTLNITCILVATYCFLRHNSLCEPYVYTIFALAEYLVVLSNMAFHWTACFDFTSKDLVLYKYGLALTQR